MARLALPFIADETPADRSVGRVALTFVAGAAAGVAGILLSGIVAIILFPLVANLIAAPRPEDLVPIDTLLNRPDLAVGNLRLTLQLTVFIPVTVAGGVAAWLLVSKYILRRAPRTYLSVEGRFRWRLAALGLAANLVLFAPIVLLENRANLAAGHYPLRELAWGLGPCALFVVVNFVFLVVGALAEEVLFRGWLLRHVAALSRSPWAAVAITAALFSLAHGEFSLAPLIALAIMGAGYAWMSLRTGGVETATGVHAANNLMLALFQGPPAPAESGDWTLTPENYLDFGATALSYLVIAEIAARLVKTAPAKDGDLGDVIAA